jgi:pimeloyl-ACP methyl ester carboxylesterase
MKTLQFRGHAVRYVDVGSGAPVLFLHGRGNDHRTWDRQLEYFAGSRRVLAVDHIGHGESDAPEIDYTLELFTGMLAAFIERLELAPAALVGHCTGAATALDYALRRPGDVSRLVVFGVATERTLLAGPLAAVSWGFAADPAARDLFVRRLELEGLPRQATDASLEMQLGDPAAPDPDFAAHTFHLYNKRGQMRVFYNSLSQFASFRPLDEISRPPGFPPVLLFWGGSNKILPLHGAAELAASLRPEQFEVLPGCGHLAMRERPDEINRKIEAFLAAPAGAPSGAALR